MTATPTCEPHVFNDIQTSARLFGGMPIAVFGIITNVINIVVFLDPEMRCSLVNYFLLVLSISDLLLLICNFLMLIFPVIASMSNSVVLHDSYPMILWYSYPVGLSTQTCGVYLTVLVSVHRSITLTELKLDAKYNIITKCIMYTLVMFVIPFITLIIVNWRIIVALKESTRMRNMHSSRKSNQSRILRNFRLLKNAKYSDIFGKFGRLNFNPLRNSPLLKTNGNSVRDRSVTLMLLAIVAIFLCCNCLAFCNNIYEIVNNARAHIEHNTTETGTQESVTLKDSAENQDVFDFSVELSNILISLNSSSSMFVYLIFSSKYRCIIKHWLGLEKRKRVNGVALTTAMVAQRALELSILPDELEARRNKNEKKDMTRRKNQKMIASESDLTIKDMRIVELENLKDEELVIARALGSVPLDHSTDLSPWNLRGILVYQVYVPNRQFPSVQDLKNMIFEERNKIDPVMFKISRTSLHYVSECNPLSVKNEVLGLRETSSLATNCISLLSLLVIAHVVPIAPAVLNVEA
uniref:G_PROTEIN_RECEP_F1_2 domain-containing protein n=1 Tax=Heterorhabditis bacteriophora TaxID=37862 RepID=A0A1I7XFB9_HETBA